MENIRQVAFCPHCSNRAPQTLLLRHHCSAQVWFEWDELDSDEEGQIEVTYFVATCDTCQGLLLYAAFDEHHFGKEFHLTRLLWPQNGVTLEAVPDRVADIYSEALKIKNIAPNAFAVQIRRALEAICEDRGARGGTLQSRLKELCDRGELPPVLAMVTDVLRTLGNAGAHAADLSVRPSMVYALDEFFRVVVEYVYVAPSKLKEFQNRLKSIKEKKSARKDT